MPRRLRIFAAVGLALVLVPAIAYALDGRVDGKPVPELQVTVDTLWTVIAGILVFIMQAGFAMVEGGFTRAKNVANIMMKNVGDFSMAALGFWILGFGIMFGNGNAFLGFTGFFVSADTGELYQSLSWTSVSDLDGVVLSPDVLCHRRHHRGRRHGGAHPILELSGFQFRDLADLLSHGGALDLGRWMAGGAGMLDFAGSTVVHSTGAWFALAGVIVLGPRLGKYSDMGMPLALPGHNLMLATLGVFILWFGWFGFNTGSTMGARVADISVIAANTSLAAAAAAIGATVTAWLKFGKPDVTMALNGALSGLVAVTGACAYVEPWTAVLFFGFLPGVVVVFSVLMFDQLQIDDPVGRDIRPWCIRRVGDGPVGAVSRGLRAALRRRSRLADGPVSGRSGCLRFLHDMRSGDVQRHQERGWPARVTGSGAGRSGRGGAWQRRLSRIWRFGSGGGPNSVVRGPVPETCCRPCSGQGPQPWSRTATQADRHSRRRRLTDRRCRR